MAEENEIKVQNDGSLFIAVGSGRKEINWKNREWTWGQFLNKIKETRRTNETMAEYRKASKSRQDEIKDVGGFVGGYINGGRRNKGSVMERTMATLDIDFATGDIWDDFCLLFNCAAVVYSTHKHTPDTPRLRLIIPFSRPVTPAEYQAICRYVTAVIGIDMFDDTTYEPERLMYWPSTSIDGQYLFRYQDGEWLDVESILATYKNWRDTSKWPVSSRVDVGVRREIKKQGDPLEKSGIVGAFCRTYNIHQVIETFLSEEYVPCGIDNRYTYVHGSTAAGLVVYDDKFAYSHHGTDPSSGKLCNAFDLVRLHLFGDKDEGIDKESNRNITKYPSYLAMEEFASKDTNVKKTIFTERNASAKCDFADVDFVEDEDQEWKEKLDCNKKGICEKSRKNLLLILKNDPNVAGCFAVDKFSNRAALLRLPMWRKTEDTDMFMRDDDLMNLRAYLETVWEIDAKDKINDALGIVARDNAIHPVKEYLSGLSWDGIKRVDTVFIDYLGVEDNPLYRLCTRISLTACVARILSPGCDFDYTTVLVGAQGVGKSKLLAKLCTNKMWFNDAFSVDGKESYENLRGKWIVEIAELAGIKKADMDSVKKFLTKTSDFYRAAFEHYPQDQMRQCVFFGTTNNLNFLRDVTGDRRFWPMEVCADRITKNQWTDLTDYEIGQIWAEAIHYYNEGQQLYLPKDMEEEMNSRREIYTEVDDRIGLIQQYLDTKLPPNWATMDIQQRRNFLAGNDSLMPEGVVVRDRVCAIEIGCECLGMRKSDITKYVSSEIISLVRKIGGWKWSGKKTYRVAQYGKVHCFLRELPDDMTGTRGTTYQNEEKSIF